MKTERVLAAAEVLRVAWDILKEEAGAISITASNALRSTTVQISSSCRANLEQLPGEISMRKYELSDGTQCRELKKDCNGVDFFIVSPEESSIEGIEKE